ncbi:MAG: aldo/keto reductase [Anaerolineales bacterium]|nr:MAG: aldo/keto reductase [Anaerolineales bacterium]
MEYRSLGRTGVMVSPVCLGTMNFGDRTDETTSIAIINKAIENGINFIDTADAYSRGQSEIVVGKALAENGLRDQIVLATKVHGRMGSGVNEAGLSRYHIMKACEDSLRRLQTDHIDLYQLHRPDLSIPQDETLRALDDLVRAGKVRYIGASNHAAWMVMESIAISERLGLARLISEQPPYNFLDRRAENELIPLAMKHGLAILPWSPLAGGILSGKYTLDMEGGDQYPTGTRAAVGWAPILRRINHKALEVATAVKKMADERGMNTAQLAYLWCKDQPGITAPIIGPRTMAHLDDALAIADQYLDAADRPLFDALVHPGNAVSDFHNANPWMKARLQA